MQVILLYFTEIGAQHCHTVMMTSSQHILYCMCKETPNSSHAGFNFNLNVFMYMQIICQGME